MSEFWTTVATIGGSIAASALTGVGAARFRSKQATEASAAALAPAPPQLDERTRAAIAEAVKSAIEAERQRIDTAVKASIETWKAELQREVASVKADVAVLRAEQAQAQRDGQSRWDALMRSVGRIEGMLEADGSGR